LAVPDTVFGDLHDSVHCDLQGSARYLRYRAATSYWAHLSQPCSSGRAARSSPFGAAGALIVLMFWTYYFFPSQIFLFGAELTKAIAEERAPAAALAARAFSTFCESKGFPSAGE
jgi:hypothetical protein